ncbi:MAG: hypothetical protein KDD40_06695 [Bdellovibrionales bacterium]|nr:hypothetical protein [Bdellovibrionales bacterium]
MNRFYMLIFASSIFCFQNVFANLNSIDSEFNQLQNQIYIDVEGISSSEGIITETLPAGDLYTLKKIGFTNDEILLQVAEKRDLTVIDKITGDSYTGTYSSRLPGALGDFSRARQAIRDLREAQSLNRRMEGYIDSSSSSSNNRDDSISYPEGSTSHRNNNGSSRRDESSGSYL